MRPVRHRQHFSTYPDVDGYVIGELWRMPRTDPYVNPAFEQLILTPGQIIASAAERFGSPAHDLDALTIH